MKKKLAFRQKHAILIILYYEVTKKVMDSYVAKQESGQLIQRMYKLTTNRYL